jgi:hypothetical protein
MSEHILPAKHRARGGVCLCLVLNKKNALIPAEVLAREQN